ncbi:MAG: peptidoglycan DD-metalloendopeptidase family protein [Hyphomicrobium sp.]
MMYLTGFGWRGCFDLKPVQCAALVLSVAAAGCSADVTRFDSASFNLNDPPEETAAVQPSSGPVRGHSDYDNPVTRSQRPGPYGAGAKDVRSGGGVEMAALPDATPPASQPASPPAFGTASPPPSSYTAAPGAMPPGRKRPMYRPAAAPAVPAATQGMTQDLAKGDVLEVQPGDTLYGLSRRHQVSVAELMSVNSLTAANLKPGQKLYLPAGKAAQGGPPPAQNYAALQPPRTGETQAAVQAPVQNSAQTPAQTPAQAVPAATPPSPELLAKYTSTYTVKQGDSLYAVARAHKVPFTELQQVNGITNPLKVRPGVTLRVPAGYAMTAAATPAAAMAGRSMAGRPMATGAVTPPSASEPVVSAVAAPPAPVISEPAPTGVPATSAQPTIINSEKVAPPAASTSPVNAPPAAGGSKGDRLALNVPTPDAAGGDASKLRWPAQGKIIAGFGGRPDGTHNDGINLSVPQGTEVHAAEGGVVAYAGSELKGYGNLVLVRHDNGWVTAYAHNEELLVKRGDKVKRGQVISKAGKTGTVDQPQIHFELRQGSKPVDPTPFMEKI